ncbi:Emopamil-binding protein [Aulographum hederae CBS 113979]|uniref:Emopamil-binding protein n=1 Tax=Aulographum hederae CBS 113979 TaxID=1176131 RepID=A0A6G1GK80_9PEZI|nr:Emopamil-binding protein [Aulographum hederae CBS 113979]
MATAVIDATTISSLLAALSLLLVAYFSSKALQPSSTSSAARTLFIWHLFDALIHFIFEGSFLYNCFYVFQSTSVALNHLGGGGHYYYSFTPPGVYFGGQDNKWRIHGAGYGTGWSSKLWQEYANADRRWGGVDLTVVSLEVLTVGIGGPLALWVCWMLRKGEVNGKTAFWMTVLATGELYGGFMTFAPEWFSGSPHLNTSSFLYLWVYLIFFNMLWVFLPLYSLYVAYGALTGRSVSKRASKKAVKSA